MARVTCPTCGLSYDSDISDKCLNCRQPVAFLSSDRRQVCRAIYRDTMHYEEKYNYHKCRTHENRWRQLLVVLGIIIMSVLIKGLVGAGDSEKKAQMQLVLNEKQRIDDQVTTTNEGKEFGGSDLNKIEGITGNYTTKSKIAFNAVGYGMDNSTPCNGDIRFVPESWSVVNKYTWDGEPYSAAFGMANSGEYTLVVVFRQEKSEKKQEEYIPTGVYDTKNVHISITE